jgi:hypothetical protein
MKVLVENAVGLVVYRLLHDATAGGIYRAYTNEWCSFKS